MSDHYLIEIYTSFFSSNTTERDYGKGDSSEKIKFDFSKFNYERTDFEKVNLEFSIINWDEIISGNIDEIPDKFNGTVFTVLQKNSMLLKKNNYSTIENRFTKNRSIIKRKISKSKKLLHYSNCNENKRTALIEKIERLRELHKQSFIEERISAENKAIEKIKLDSKYFYKYANSFKKVSTEPRILQDTQGEVIMDKKAIADILQQQFNSVFSNPKKCVDYNPPFSKPKIIKPLLPLEITNEKVIKAINEIKVSSSCPKYEIPARVLKDCKNTLCVPIKMLWKKSFEIGKVPSQYKQQLIIPIYKKGPKTKPENFRPVSLSAHVIKVFERILRDVLSEYFESNFIFNSNQHGFRRQRSCLTQILSHTNFIQSGLVEGVGTDCIYIDYAKAFDKVDHGVLIKKLGQYGVNGNYIKWIENFLSDRHQMVFIDGHYSFPTSVISGVPQGSVLGPLLFIIYLNDLPTAINNATVLTFADDTKIATKIHSANDKNLLQKNLEVVTEWSKYNNMELNSNKFELLCHTPKIEKTEEKILQIFEQLPFSDDMVSYKATENISIDKSPFVRDLGVFVDCHLDWKVHIDKISKKAKQISGWILSVFYTRDKCTMLTLFNSLVRSRLEYLCEVWSPQQKQDIVKIEQVQRSFTFRITGMNQFNYWDRLKNLNIMSLQRRREKLIILHVWKILNNKTPNSIGIQFKFNERFFSIRADVKSLPSVRGSVLTKFENSFVIKSAKLWNIIPPNLTTITSLNLFKMKLENFLSQIADEPPLPGYPFRLNSNNSLLNTHS